MFVSGLSYREVLSEPGFREQSLVGDGKAGKRWRGWPQYGVSGGGKSARAVPFRPTSRNPALTRPPRVAFSWCRGPIQLRSGI